MTIGKHCLKQSRLEEDGNKIIKQMLERKTAAGNVPTVMDNRGSTRRVEIFLADLPFSKCLFEQSSVVLTHASPKKRKLFSSST